MLGGDGVTLGLQAECLFMFMEEEQLLLFHFIVGEWVKMHMKKGSMSFYVFWSWGMGETDY